MRVETVKGGEEDRKRIDKCCVVRNTFSSAVREGRGLDLWKGWLNAERNPGSD